MQFINKTIFGSFIFLTQVPNTFAQVNDIKVLPTINSVSNLIEQKNQDTLAAVTVIDRTEIESKNFNSLQDLLRTVPSVSYTNNGGQGKTTGISIRGTNSNAVLVLVDGQKVGSATLGQTAFEHLPISQIERVEIVRGPRSSLYGSEAIGGVIKIYTRKGSTQGLKPFANFTYGSHETYEANVGFNARSENSWATLSVAGLKTQGINASTLNESEDLDRDGYENASASLRAGHTFNDRLDVSMNVLHVVGNNDFDNQDDWGYGAYTDTPNVHSKIEQAVYGTNLKYKANDRWTTELKLGVSQDKQHTYDAYPAEINTQRDTLSWLNTIQLSPKHNLVSGFDYQVDKVTGSTRYDEDTRYNLGYFAQYLGSIGKFDLQGALRIDDNQQFGNQTTGNTTLGYHLTDQVLAYATYGTAFRAPTFNDLYYPYSGNPNLNPEKSENYEIGFKGQHTYLNWELNAFDNKVENLISWAEDASGNWLPSNVQQARIRGIELVLGQSLDHFVWNFNYTYQDPENCSRGEERNQLIYKPKQLLNLSADYSMQNWTVGGSFHAEDSRRTGDYTPDLSGYVLFDTRVTYRVTPEFSIQGKLANAFDVKNITNTGYHQDGRTAWVTLRYAMK